MWWQAVRKELPRVRFGARQKETHAAMRADLLEEGRLADDHARNWIGTEEARTGQSLMRRFKPT
jgi:hypothetical protein